jgi:hypothetical protein
MLKNKESVVEHLNLSNKGIVSVLNPVEDLLWKKIVIVIHGLQLVILKQRVMC